MNIRINQDRHCVGKKASVCVCGTKVTITPKNKQRAIEIETKNYGTAAFLRDLIDDCFSSGEDVELAISQDEQ